MQFSVESGPSLDHRFDAPNGWLAEIERFVYKAINDKKIRRSGQSSLGHHVTQSSAAVGEQAVVLDAERTLPVKQTGNQRLQNIRARHIAQMCG